MYYTFVLSKRKKNIYFIAFIVEWQTRCVYVTDDETGEHIAYSCLQTNPIRQLVCILCVLVENQHSKFGEKFFCACVFLAMHILVIET